MPSRLSGNMNFETFFKTILKDVKTDVTAEFDLNFKHKAFFDRKWPETNSPNRRGSLLMRSGALRRGNQSRIQGDLIIFTNSKPYANLHNQGGTITVTAKMKGFFWAMYYKAAGAESRAYYKEDGSFSHSIHSSDSNKKVKKTFKSTSKKAIRMQIEAEYWKSLALMKVGDKVTIKQRQFIGSHPKIDTIIKKHFDAQMKDIEQQITKMLKP